MPLTPRARGGGNKCELLRSGGRIICGVLLTGGRMPVLLLSCLCVVAAAADTNSKPANPGEVVSPVSGAPYRVLDRARIRIRDSYSLSCRIRIRI